MNYLGHLCLSPNDYEIMLANLFGDFIKGKDYTYLPFPVQIGIKLHRQIDDYVDNYPLVKELRLQLYHDLPKIAGIAIDLYFDHLLAKNWEKYYRGKTLNNFTQDFLEYALQKIRHGYPTENFQFPPDFIYLLEMMYKHDWINGYQQFSGLIKSSTNLSKRLPYPNQLNLAGDVFYQHEKLITETFKIFMGDAILKFR